MMVDWEAFMAEEAHRADAVGEFVPSNRLDDAEEQVPPTLR